MIRRAIQVIYKEKKSLDIFDKSKIWFTSLSSRDYVMKKVHRKLILIIFFSWQLESGHKKMDSYARFYCIY